MTNEDTAHVGDWALNQMKEIGKKFHDRFPDTHHAEGMLALLGALYLALSENTNFDIIDKSLRDLRKKCEKTNFN